MRFIVTFISTDDEIDVYMVEDIKKYDDKWKVKWVVDVWVSYGKPRCTGCQGPLVAMSASCPHAKAVKRHLATNPKPWRSDEILR